MCVDEKIMRRGFAMNNTLRSKLVITTMLCGFAALSANRTMAEEFTPTRGADAAYTVTPVDSCTEGTSATGGCFKTVSGYDESGNPIYQYYTYTVTISDDKKAARATTANEINNNTASGKSYIGIAYDAGSSSAYGGAIYNNQGTITTLTGDFIGNYAKSSSDHAYGGAIYNNWGFYNNWGSITTLTGDFIGNYASGSSFVRGGAIYNVNGATITTLTGDFIGNYAKSTGSSYAEGGAIYNEYGTITTLTGDFIGNYALSSSSYGRGGAIYNYNATISTLTGDFIGNYAQSSFIIIGAQ